MADFFKRSTTWVIDFRYEGRPRRWFRVFREGADPTAALRQELESLYGDRVQFVQARVATAEEETQFLRGEEARNVYCPTGRRGGAER